MQYKDYIKHYKIKGEVEDVYAALTNPFTIELWSDEAAIMSTEAGSEFEIFGGSICGRNIECIENEKIVQEWYFGDQEKESIVTISLKKAKGKVEIKLVHTNIPVDDFDDICDGWNEDYFGSIKQLIENV